MVYFDNNARFRVHKCNNNILKVNMVTLFILVIKRMLAKNLIITLYKNQI